VRVAYSLEYGIDEMEMHRDAVGPAERIILVDDLIATGGTAEAAVKLLRSLGAEILAACFIIDLPELGGTARLAACRCRSVRLLPFRDTEQPARTAGTIILFFNRIRASQAQHYVAVIRHLRDPNPVIIRAP